MPTRVLGCNEEETKRKEKHMQRMTQDDRIAEKQKDVQNAEKKKKKILCAMSKCWLEETQGMTNKV